MRKVIAVLAVVMVFALLPLKAMATDTTTKWFDLHDKGVQYLKSKQYDKAIEVFTSLIALSPGSSSAYNNRGVAYNKKGQPDRAIEDFTKACDMGFNLGCRNLQDTLQIKKEDRLLDLVNYNIGSVKVKKVTSVRPGDVGRIISFTVEKGDIRAVCSQDAQGQNLLTSITIPVNVSSKLTSITGRKGVNFEISHGISFIHNIIMNLEKIAGRRFGIRDYCMGSLTVAWRLHEYINTGKGDIVEQIFFQVMQKDNTKER